jgi:hypothetical protein
LRRIGWAGVGALLLGAAGTVAWADALNEALDTEEADFAVVGNGSLEWAIDVVDTHDGVDAVRSPLVSVPSVGSQAYFGISTEVEGPAEVRFWWRSAGGGAVRVFVDHTWTSSMPQAAGDWAAGSVSLGLGRHLVAWRLDVAVGAAGGGQFWLDAVEVVRPPLAITNGPLAEGEVGEPFDFHITTTHPANAFAASPLPEGLRIDPGTGRITGVPVVAGETTTRLSAANAEAGAEADLRIRILPRAMPLGEALDGEGLIWLVSPQTVWRGRRLGGGLDAAFPDRARQVYFPDLPDYAALRLETTVTGPDVITFNWKPQAAGASSDALRLFLDGQPVPPRFIPGGAGHDWSDERIEVPPGEHTLRWVHSGADWSETGVDRVIRAGSGQLCLTGPRRMWFAVGTPVHERVAVNRQVATFSATALPPGLILEPLTGLLRGAPAQAGDFVCEVTVSDGQETAVMRLVLSVTATAPGAALGQPERPWLQEGSGWQPLTPDGIEVFPPSEGTAEFGATERVAFETEVVGPDVVRFDWDASYSFINGGRNAAWHFSMNGTEARSLWVDTGEGGVQPGTVGWRQESVAVPAGRHRLRWQFTGSRPSGCCAGGVVGRLRSLQFDSDGTTFAAWAARAGLGAGEAAPEHDPDGDALTNWAEYAFQTNPTVADGAAPGSITRLGPVIETEFTLRSGGPSDLEYAVEHSEALKAGSWGSVGGSVMVAGPGRLIVRAPMPDSEGWKKHFRLVARLKGPSGTGSGGLRPP